MGEAFSTTLGPGEAVGVSLRRAVQARSKVRRLRLRPRPEREVAEQGSCAHCTDAEGESKGRTMWSPGQ